MASKKTLPEVLQKYQPDEKTYAWMMHGQNIRVLADREQKILQIDADFDILLEKEALYRMEDEVCRIYQIRQFSLRPHYPAARFHAVFSTNTG